MATIKELRNKLEKHKATSAWDKGVKDYAEWMIDRLEENGATSWNGNKNDLKSADYKWEYERNPRRIDFEDWKEESYNGSWDVYDGDIAKTLSTPSELKRLRYKEGGWKKPNAREEWLDVQARALYQAANLLQNLYEEIKAEKAKPKAVKLSQPKMTNSKLSRMSRGI